MRSDRARKLLPCIGEVRKLLYADLGEFGGKLLFYYNVSAYSVFHVSIISHTIWHQLISMISVEVTHQHAVSGLNKYWINLFCFCFFSKGGSARQPEWPLQEISRVVQRRIHGNSDVFHGSKHVQQLVSYECFVLCSPEWWIEKIAVARVSRVQSGKVCRKASDHSLLARFHVVVPVGTPRLPKVRRSSLSCSDGARCKRIDIFVRCRSEGSMVQLQLDKQVT